MMTSVRRKVVLPAGLILIGFLWQPAAADNCNSAKKECGETGSAEFSDTEVRYPEYNGPKHVIAVLPFVNRVKDVYGSEELGNGLTEIIVTQLYQSNRFYIVEREAIQDIVREQELGLTGLVNQETAASTGRLAGAQFMIKGAITEFNAKAGGGGLTLTYRTGEVGGKTRKAYVGIDVRLVDNTTGEVLGAYHASAEARATSASIGTNFRHLGEAFKIGASTFASSPMGKAVREAVRKVITYILEESTNVPWQGSVVKGDSRVYINRGKGTGVNEGDEFQVFAKGEELIDPDTGFNLGSDEEYLCDVRVTKVAPKFSVARKSPACSGLNISRGDLVRFR